RRDFLEKGGRDFMVHKYSLNGIAHARTLRLCVNDYPHRHIEVRFPVHIRDADSDVVFDHRHPRITNDRFDQSPATTRNNEIDILVHLGHMPYAIPTSFWNEQDTVFG